MYKARYISLKAIFGAAKAFSLIEHAVSRSHPPTEINDNLKEICQQVMSIGLQSISTQNLVYLTSFHTRIVANIVFITWTLLDYSTAAISTPEASRL